ncbi:MAG: AAA family ATPase, partial [Fimbriimonas sp.]
WLTKTHLHPYKDVLRLHSDLNLPSEAQWILPGIIPMNGLVVLASAPKTGKTVMVNAIARAIATGGTFAGIGWDQKFGVAWCAHEETREERGPLLAGLTPEDPFYVALAEDLPNLDDPDCDHGLDRYGRYRGIKLPYAYEAARRANCGLMVVDCLHAAVRHSNLADNNVARRIMGKLRHWSNEFGIATIVLHHLTKTAHRGYHPERFADSAQILASASCYFFLEAEEQEDGTRRVILHGAGRQPAPPRRQEFIATSLFDYQRVEPAEKVKPPTTADLIANLLHEGWELTAEEIAKRLELKLKTVQNILTGLPGIERMNVPTRKARYRMP